MDKVTLKASKRTVVGRKVKNLRKDGILPANLYGKKIKSHTLQIPEKEFSAVFGKVGETGLVELTLEGQVHPVLVHNVTYHPVTGFPLHVDFFQVDLKEKVQTRVPLSFVGESAAVKDKLGVLLNIISEIEIEALPADLPDKLEVDINKLAAVGDTLKVSDLKVSDKIRILTDANSEVIKVAPLVSKEAEQLAKEEAEAKAAAQASAATAAGTAGVAGEAKPQEAPAAPQKAPASAGAPPASAPPASPQPKKE